MSRRLARKQLVLQLPEQWFGLGDSGLEAESAGEARASWVLRDIDRPAGSLFHGSLKDAAIQAAGARVVVLVPAESVLLAQASLPAIKGNKLAKAVPYALEEQLAEDVEDLHVAIGHRDEQGMVSNAVVSRDSIDSWLSRLTAAGLHPDIMSPDVFGVHWDKDAEDTQWSLVINGTHALMRTGAQTGLAFEAENMSSVLQACLDSAGDSFPSSLTVVGCGEELDDLFEGSAIQNKLTTLCAEKSIELFFRQSDEDCSVLLAQGFDEGNAINLLQGAYSRKEQIGKMLRPWRTALILAAVWLVLQVGNFIVDYSRLSSLAEKQRAEIISIFQQALPGSRLVPGSEKELMSRALEKLRGGGGGDNSLLSLLAQAGKIFKETNGITLRSVRYKDGKLDVGLNITDLQSLDVLKQSLKNKAKLNVEIISASSRNGKVESRLSIKAMSSGGGS
jgi:general secretion pathway protein L